MPPKRRRLNLPHLRTTTTNKKSSSEHTMTVHRARHCSMCQKYRTDEEFSQLRLLRKSCRHPFLRNEEDCVPHHGCINCCNSCLIISQTIQQQPKDPSGVVLYSLSRRVAIPHRNAFLCSVCGLIGCLNHSSMNCCAYCGIQTCGTCFEMYKCMNCPIKSCGECFLDHFSIKDRKCHQCKSSLECSSTTTEGKTSLNDATESGEIPRNSKSSKQP